MLFSWMLSRNNLVFLLLLLFMSQISVIGQETSVAANIDDAFPTTINQQLVNKAEEAGTVRVIVKLSTSNISPITNQSPANFSTIRNSVQQSVSSSAVRLSSDWDIPYMALEVNQADLLRLYGNPSISFITEENLYSPSALAISGWREQMRVSDVWSNGYTGSGLFVAVLDTGFDTLDSVFTSTTIYEACFSSGSNNPDRTSLCGNGADQQIGMGSAPQCIGRALCTHGTEMAKIIAGDNDNFRGVAPDVGLIAIQVFHENSSADNCGSAIPCLLASDIDIINALQYVSDLQSGSSLGNLTDDISGSISAVNMSLGKDIALEVCDALANPTGLPVEQQYQSYLDIIDTLALQNIISLSSAGNNDGLDPSSYDETDFGLNVPACFSNTWSVGSFEVTPSGILRVPSYSNSSANLDLLAPGGSISDLDGISGTSVATAFASGAVAIAREQLGDSASFDSILSYITSSGVQLTDAKSGIRSPILRFGQQSIQVSTTQDLVQALERAQTDSFDITIILNQGTFILNMPSGDIDGINSQPNGLPSVQNNVTIIGNGATIIRDESSPNFRIFHVRPSGNLTLENLTIQNGRLSPNDSQQGVGFGAGILNEKGQLTLRDVSVTQNAGSSFGGGIANFDGVLLISGSDIRENHAVVNGGGIYNIGSTGYATTRISETEIVDNTVNLSVPTVRPPATGHGIVSTFADLYLETTTISDASVLNPPYANGIATYDDVKFEDFGDKVGNLDPTLCEGSDPTRRRRSGYIFSTGSTRGRSTFTVDTSVDPNTEIVVTVDGECLPLDVGDTSTARTINVNDPNKAYEIFVFELDPELVMGSTVTLQDDLQPPSTDTFELAIDPDEQFDDLSVELELENLLLENPEIKLGDELIFNIKLDNSTDTVANGIDVNLSFPDGLEFLGSNSPLYRHFHNTNTGVWNAERVFINSDTAPITVRLLVGTSTVLNTELTVTASINQDDTPLSDALAANNTSDVMFSVVDVLPPQVVSTTPVAGASSVSLNSDVTVTFNQSVIITNSNAMQLECPSGVTQTLATVEPIGAYTQTLTATLTSPLPLNTACELTLISSEIQNANAIVLDGNADGVAGDDFTSNFTTEASKCFAYDGATTYNTINGSALQQAVDENPLAETIKVAGECLGAYDTDTNGQSETLFIGNRTVPLTIIGGYDAGSGDPDAIDWNATPDHITHPTVLDANFSGQVVDVANSSQLVTLDGLVLQHGSGEDAGAIANRGNLKLIRVLIQNNTGNIAGAIYDQGQLLIEQSSIVFNTSVFSGATLYFLNSTANIVNTTISTNDTNAFAGYPIFAQSSDIELKFVTLAENNLGFNGGNIANNNSTIRLRASILDYADTARNVTNCIGIVDTNAENIVSDGTCQGSTNRDPRLLPLSTSLALPHHPIVNYGETVSPALDHITSSRCLNIYDGALDQRGAVRPQDGGCEAGAYEVDNSCDFIDFPFNVPENDVTALRTAINCANITGGNQTISLSSDLVIREPYFEEDGLPEITGDMTIQGNGHTISRLESVLDFRFFNVAVLGDLSLYSLKLENGSATTGGGAIRTRGQVTIESVHFDNNRATNGASGGAIVALQGSPDSPMTLIVLQSLFNNNSASDSGGAIARIGSLTTFANYITVSNSTFWGNTAQYGGAFYTSRGITRITLINNTITKNDATSGAGLYVDPNVSGGGVSPVLRGGQFFLYNNLISGNTNGECYSPTNYSSGISGRNNVIGFNGSSRGCNTLSHSSNIIPTVSLRDIFDVDSSNQPRLGNNGGTLPTVELASESPVIDTGDNSWLIESTYDPPIDHNGDGDTDDTLVTDARNDATNYPRIVSQIVDIGAIEDDSCLAYISPYIVGTNIRDLNEDIIKAVECFNTNDNDSQSDIIDLNGQTITFTQPYTSNSEGTTSNALPAISSTMAIQNGAFDALPANENELFRFITLRGSGNVAQLTIDNIVFVNGGGDSLVGGAINTAGGGGPRQLIITNSKFISNRGINGGAIYSSRLGRDVVIANTYFIGNVASDKGSALYFRENGSINIDIVNSMFIDNHATTYGTIVAEDFTPKISIHNSTITNNTADGITAGVYYDPRTGSGNIINGVEFNLYNTIVSGNTATAGNDDCFFAVPINNAAHSIFGDNDDDGGCNQFDVSSNNLIPSVDVTEIVRVVFDESVGTTTALPLINSPTIDAGSNVLLPLESNILVDIDGDGNVDDPIDVDIRSDSVNFPRTFNGIVDIGAVEAIEPAPPVFVFNCTPDAFPYVLAADPFADSAVERFRAALECAKTYIEEAVIELQTDIIIYDVDNVYVGNNGLPTITSNVRIEGNGHTIERGYTECTISDNDPDFRFFYIVDGAKLTLDELTVRNGCVISTVSFGDDITAGAIFAETQSYLIVQNSTFMNNYANRGGALIFADGLIINSIFSNNTASIGGAINLSFEEGLTDLMGVIANSTFIDNYAGGQGGAINNSGAATIVNSTIAGNRTPGRAGGIRHGGHTYVFNSILVGNVGGDCFGADSILNIYDSIYEDCNPEATDQNNTIGTVASTLENTNGEPILADNGGLTQTIALLDDSLALNTGNNQWLNESVISAQVGFPVDLTGDGDTDDVISTDQRGSGFPRIANGTVDIGAFELIVFNIADVNGDGIISPVDVVYVVNRMASSDFSADVDANGVIDMNDVNAVQNLLGTTPE